jgi:DNA processing protein
MRPLPNNFLERNRIISGLSVAVVLINVAARSGANNTAHHALRQGREVFCVPANVDSPENEGVTRLLREGAGIAANAYDVLVEFEHLFPGMLDLNEARRDKTQGRPTPSPQRRAESPAAPEKSERNGNVSNPEKSVKLENSEPPAKQVPPRDPPKLEGAQKTIYDLLNEEPMHVDQICEMSGLPAKEVSVSLTLLELSGNIISLPGKFFKKR